MVVVVIDIVAGRANSLADSVVALANMSRPEEAAAVADTDCNNM